MSNRHSRYSDLRAKLGEGKVIIAHPDVAADLRGLSYDFMVLDEAWKIPDHQMDAMRYLMDQMVVKELASEEEQVKAALVKAGVPLPDPSWPIEQQQAHIALHLPPDFKLQKVKRTNGSAMTFANPAAGLQTAPDLLAKISEAMTKAAAPQAQPLYIPDTYRRRT